jgi:E3 ubiquitin-protein ligase CCNP1IP1
MFGTGMQVDQDNLRRKNEELSQVLRDKSRKLLQTQELYDKLKRRAMLGQVQDAASEFVDDTIQASTTANRFVDRIGAQNQRPTSHPIYQNAQSGGSQNPGRGLNTGMNMGPPPINRSGHADGTWSGFSSQGSQGNVPRERILAEFPLSRLTWIQENQPIQTPSTHRQRLNPGNAPAPPRMGLSNLQSGMSSAPIPNQGISPSGRQALSNLNANSAAGPGFAGYGMSAGLKVSNPAGSVTNGVERPIIRSRGLLQLLFLKVL